MRASLVALLTAAAAAFAVSFAALAGTASWSDDAYQRELVPARRAAASAIRQGDLPLWWDGAGFGAPMLQAPRAAALYPGSWLSARGWGVDIVGVLHLVLLGAATGALAVRCRRQTASAEPRGARVLAAALPAASGVGGAAIVGGWIASLAWLVVALAILAAWGEQRRRAAGLTVALAAVVVGGGAELLLLAVVALAVQVARASAHRLPLLLALALSLAMSAAAWLPWVAAGAPGLSTGPLLSALAILALGLAARGVARWLASASAAGGAAAAVCALALLVPQRPALDRGPLDELPAWLAAPLPASLAASRDRGVPLRVFCPPRTAARDLAAGEPGAPLHTTWPATGLRCAQAPLPASSAGEAALWQRGAGAGGRLLRRLSIPLAIVPASTVNAVGFQRLGSQGSWALVALASRPIAAVYPSTVGVADAAAARSAVVPPAGQAGAAAAQLVVEGGPGLGAAPTPRAELAGPEDAEAALDHAHEHAHLAHEPVEVTAPLLEGAPPEACAVVAWRPGEISLSCPALPVPGVAAVASAWAPGWRVAVDGAAAPSLRVEALLRGAQLPASTSAGTSSHAIVWSYRPPAWPVAAALSALGLAAFACLALWPSAAALRAILRRRR